MKEKNLTSEQQFIKKVGTAPSPLPLWVSLNHNKTEDAENPLKSRQQFKTK